MGLTWRVQGNAPVAAQSRCCGCACRLSRTAKRHLTACLANRRSWLLWCERRKQKRVLPRFRSTAEGNGFKLRPQLHVWLLKDREAPAAMRPQGLMPYREYSNPLSERRKRRPLSQNPRCLSWSSHTVAAQSRGRCCACGCSWAATAPGATRAWRAGCTCSGSYTRSRICKPRRSCWRRGCRARTRAAGGARSCRSATRRSSSWAGRQVGLVPGCA